MDLSSQVHDLQHLRLIVPALLPLRTSSFTLASVQRAQLLRLVLSKTSTPRLKSLSQICLPNSKPLTPLPGFLLVKLPRHFAPASSLKDKVNNGASSGCVVARIQWGDYAQKPSEQYLPSADAQQLFALITVTTTYCQQLLSTTRSICSPFLLFWIFHSHSIYSRFLDF